VVHPKPDQLDRFREFKHTIIHLIYIKTVCIIGIAGMYVLDKNGIVLWSGGYGINRGAQYM
jgi:hypothetical protein